MATVAHIVKSQRKPKFSVRQKNRCLVPKCGRPHGYMRKFGVCRIHFREFASAGMLPGVRKASW